MLNIESEITKMNLPLRLIEKLNNKKLYKIKDIWSLKRKELKTLGFDDSEIKSIIIALELEGLDLNKKIYD